MSLYDEIANLSKPYLGPAAGQFIARQCTVYLNIKPENLGKPHLRELAKWVETSGARLMDSAKATDLAWKIAKL